MITYSTRQAAKMLGITQAALSKYLKAKKVPAPAMVTSGRMTLHLWTEADISRTRMLLPKIANGRKTRYRQLKEKEAQARAPVPHKSRKPKKKKKKE
jgi:predicted DNA-binding transcriptional regulator AlpA